MELSGSDTPRFFSQCRLSSPSLVRFLSHLTAPSPPVSSPLPRRSGAAGRAGLVNGSTLSQRSRSDRDDDFTQFRRGVEIPIGRKVHSRLTNMAHTCIHWFRKGLRLHDNPALLAALRDCKQLYPVFLLDPHLHNNMCINRWRFLVGALKDLDCSLRKLNSRLFVVRGRPEDVLPKLFDKWKITKLTYEYDTEPYSLGRDTAVTALAKEHGVQVIYKISHTLYDIERIIEENNGKAPLTYTRMQALVKTLGPPKKPVPAPTVEDMAEVKTPCSKAMSSSMGSLLWRSSAQTLQLRERSRFQEENRRL
ncbi:unnamed protein product [Pleuronectes platessa]|uniref:Photolyase/cryptochrome alpha/beta domain-containing protein n=1 Tax=Pleuronectes platessa TaxID=8262 RepID=A0A9N7VGK2_PLEPL|nr:unnamed protein product [Pleuronectes platessa]